MKYGFREGGHRIFTCLNIASVPASEQCRFADSIEELCDCFVIINKQTNRKYICRQHGNKYYIENSSYGEYLMPADSKVYETYGCIWTDCGLTYMAKYIDGEWKLDWPNPYGFK